MMATVFFLLLQHLPPWEPQACLHGVTKFKELIRKLIGTHWRSCREKKTRKVWVEKRLHLLFTMTCSNHCFFFLTTQDKNMSSKRDHRPHGMCYSESDAQWEDGLPNFQHVSSEGSYITPFAQVTLSLKFDWRICNKIFISFITSSMSLRSCPCRRSTTTGNDFLASPFPLAVSFIGPRSTSNILI